ncbi:MAG: SHOCT domain-containing protein [Nitrospiria bacterium]
MRHLSFLLFCFFMSACASGVGLQRVTHQEEGLLVVLDQNPIPAQHAVETPYHHPASLSEGDFENILNTIQATPEQGILGSLFSKKEPAPLFSPETAALVAARLSGALSKATSEERVNFYQTRPLDSIHVSATTGFVLVKDERLHLRVNHYRVPLRKGVHPSKAGMGLRPTEKGKYAFSLDEGEKITRRTYKNILGLSGSDPQWLVIDYTDFPKPGQTLSPASKPERPQAGKSLEERLRALKHLHEEGLITEEEYQQKKQSLLKEL